jgi:hypothetical protein
MGSRSVKVAAPVNCNQPVAPQPYPVPVPYPVQVPCAPPPCQPQLFPDQFSQSNLLAMMMQQQQPQPLPQDFAASMDFPQQQFSLPQTSSFNNFQNFQLDAQQFDPCCQLPPCEISEFTLPAAAPRVREYIMQYEQPQAPSVPRAMFVYKKKQCQQRKTPIPHVQHEIVHERIIPQSSTTHLKSGTPISNQRRVTPVLFETSNHHYVHENSPVFVHQSSASQASKQYKSSPVHIIESPTTVLYQQSQQQQHPPTSHTSYPVVSYQHVSSPNQRSRSRKSNTVISSHVISASHSIPNY